MTGGPNDPGTPVLGLGEQNTLAELVDDAVLPLIKAEDVSVADAGNHFVGDTVEETLAETALLIDNDFVGDQYIRLNDGDAVTIEPFTTGYADDLLVLNGTGKGWAGKVLIWDTQAGTGGYIDTTGDIQLDAGVSIYQNGTEYATQQYVTDNTATDADVTNAVVMHNADINTSGTIHGLKGFGVDNIKGVNEVLNVDEVKLLTLSAGASGNHFKLQFNGNKSNFITIPAGGYTDLVAADIKAALITIADWVTNTADINVVENPANTFEITFTNALGWANVGDLTVPGADLTGDLIGTPPVVVDDGTGASTVGVNGTDYLVSGIAVGDIIGAVHVHYWGNPDVGAGWDTDPDWYVRAGTDFECRTAGEVGVVGNAADWSLKSHLLFHYLDVT